MAATRVHSNVFSWAIDLLRERERYRDWSSWLVNARNRVIMLTRKNRPRVKPIRLVRYKALEQPVFVRLGSPDLWVLDELFTSDEYQAVLKADLGEVRQIVDLGSNAGISIRFWLSRWPDAKVIGVEPDDQNFEVCKLNAGQHRGGRNVSLVRACVAGRERTVTLDRSHHESMYAMTDAPAPGAGPGDGGGSATQDGPDAIPALPLTKILDQCGALPTIDLLKCDIEGAEREVFEACAPWIGRVRHMVLEVHPPYTVEALLADCERNGRRFRVLDRHPSPPNEIVFLKAED
jgi:FkbM family methyltransferase